MHFAIIFQRFGPYHHARLAAASKLGRLTAIEMGALDKTYAWRSEPQSDQFEHIILFRDRDIQDVSGKHVLKVLANTLDELQPDVVAVPGWGSHYALAALWWCMKNNVPAVMMSESTAHDFKRRWYMEKIKGQVVRSVSAGLVGGKPHAKYLSGLGVPRERVFLGYDVVDNDYFSLHAGKAKKEAAALRREQKLPDRYFLASGRFIEKKNLPRLVEAFARYLRSSEEMKWHLVLMGDGPLRHYLEVLISELDLVEHVHFVGFRQYDELPIYYGLADVFIHPSTSEQWGLVVNEAMASGLPVLVSNRCGCAPDLVHEGINGFTFDPYDVGRLAKLMLRISSDECNREAMGRASREIIGNWAPGTFAENLWKAAEAAMTAPPKRAVLGKVLLTALIHCY